MLYELASAIFTAGIAVASGAFVSQFATSPYRTVGTARQQFAISYGLFQAAAAVAEFCILVLAGTLGTAFYSSVLAGIGSKVDDGFTIGFITAITYVLIACSAGLYKANNLLKYRHKVDSRQLRAAWLLVFASYSLLIGILFLLKASSGYSRGAIFNSAFVALLLITLGRVLIVTLFERGVRSGLVRGRRAITLGELGELERLSSSDLTHFGFDEVARVALTKADSPAEFGPGERDNVLNAMNVARQAHADEFALVLSWRQQRILAETIAILRASPLPIWLLPDSTIRSVLAQQTRPGPDLSLAIIVQRQPLNLWERGLKRAIDLVLSAAALCALAPLFLLTALLIKFDSKGPALFRQRRCGFDNREFTIFKFRTMTSRDDGEVIVQAQQNDARVTRIGRLLRRTSIDELPQLLNVILGDMSLVGPRPHALAHHNQFASAIASYALRHHVKPGLTGMAQVQGLRGATPELQHMEQRVQQDLWYISHWSLPLDFWILAKTCLVVLRHEAF